MLTCWEVKQKVHLWKLQRRGKKSQSKGPQKMSLDNSETHGWLGSEGFIIYPGPFCESFLPHQCTMGWKRIPSMTKEQNLIGRPSRNLAARPCPHASRLPWWSRSPGVVGFSRFFPKNPEVSWSLNNPVPRSGMYDWIRKGLNSYRFSTGFQTSTDLSFSSWMAVWLYRCKSARLVNNTDPCYTYICT